MSTTVRTCIVKTLKRAEFDLDVSNAIEGLAQGSTVLSVSVTPIKQVVSQGVSVTTRVLVTLVAAADEADSGSLEPLGRRGH